MRRTMRVRACQTPWAGADFTPMLRRRCSEEKRGATRSMQSLNLIVGPPNSGRTGRTLSAFRSAAAREPVLVLPTVDDVERFEQELTNDGDVVIGASVGTFDQLFGLV